MSDQPQTGPRTRARDRRHRPGMLRRDQAAAYCDVSVPTWDRWTAAALNPGPRLVGGVLLWSRHELAEWGRRGCPPRDAWQAIWKTLLARP